MVSDEIQRLQARMDGLVREQSDRRALLERQGEEIKARSQEYMTKQVQAAERYVQHRRELGRREREAGGWSTEKTLADKDSSVMGFGMPEDDEHETESAAYPRATPLPSSEPVPAPAGMPEPTGRAPAPRRARPVREEEFDDDFSNTSWLD
jgi:hypothetical protein